TLFVFVLALSLVPAARGGTTPPPLARSTVTGEASVWMEDGAMDSQGNIDPRKVRAGGVVDQATAFTHVRGSLWAKKDSDWTLIEIFGCNLGPMPAGQYAAYMLIQCDPSPLALKAPAGSTLYAQAYLELDMNLASSD